MPSFKLSTSLKFPEFKDDRGSLVVWESSELPFRPARTFLIFNVPKGQTRANHGVSCDLIITAITGSVEIEIDREKTILLQGKTNALFIEKNTYIQLKNFSENSALLVFAEKPFIQTSYFS